MIDRIRLGVSYYPEQTPENEWAEDARLMADLGLDTVRIGEFCWNRMQQSNGALTLDWLQRAIELFEHRGIKTLLCTPTATPPVWVCERFPDLPLVTPDGRRGLFGGRRHYGPFHEGYRDLCRRIAASLAERFGKHPAVVGWQIDNEAGSYSILDCSPSALTAFHRYLERRYASVDELNHAWGLIFWNQEVQRFDQIPTPGEMMTTRSPQMLLEYNRFCLRGWADFILDQAREIRPHLGTDRFIMSNCEEPVAVTMELLQSQQGETWIDYAAVDNYSELLPDAGQNAMRLDRIRAIKPGVPMLAPEMQIGSGYTTTGGIVPGPRRFWAFETLARGARMLCWFHWRRFRAGCEWRLTPLVERDRVPRSTYRDIRSIICDIRKAEPTLTRLRVRPDVQVLFSLDNILARDRSSEPIFWMQIQLPDGWHHRFPLWERETRRAVYLPLSRMGLTVDFVREDQDWDITRPLVIPDLDLCPAAMIRRLETFVSAGGVVICFPGAGERDRHGAQLDLCPPGRLAGLFGCTLKDYFPIEEGKGPTFDPATGRLTREHDELPRVTTALVQLGDTKVMCDVRHGELLDAREATVLGRYAGGICDGEAAVVERRWGAGRAIYLGAVPADADAGEALFRALLGDAVPGVKTSRKLDYRVVKLDGAVGRHDMLLNDSPVEAMLPNPVTDLITGQKLDRLHPYGAALVQV